MKNVSHKGVVPPKDNRDICVCVLLVASYQDHFETQYLLPVVPTGIKKLVQIRLNLVLGSY